MNRIYIVLFCIIYHSGLCHQDSELVEDSNDNENKKMNNRDSEPVDDENEDIIEKVKLQHIKNSGAAEDGDDEKMNNRDSELVDDENEDIIEKVKLQHIKNSGTAEDGDGEKMNNRDSEPVDDENEDIIEKVKLQHIKNSGAAEDGDDEKENVEKNEEPVNNVEAENNEEPENDEDDEANNHQFNTKVSEGNLKDASGIKVEEPDIEEQAGDAADFFGTNQHYNIPVNYQDFGRRFVLTYPYVEKKNKIADDAAETEIHNTVMQHLESKKELTRLTPVKAPPEFVLQIAKRSALLEASKPIDPTNDIIQKDILRTGEYWDDVWKEEVDVEKILRSTKKQNKLDSIIVEISPGSKLHKLISMLKQRSPRFLYVIKKNTERYFPCFISRYLLQLISCWFFSVETST